MPRAAATEATGLVMRGHALRLPALAFGAFVLNGAAGQALFNEQDLHFMHHMVVHHEQALVMSELVEARSDRREFHRFADYVYRAQAAEIDLMQSLMQLAAERGANVPMHELTGDPPMAGRSWTRSGARAAPCSSDSGSRA